MIPELFILSILIGVIIGLIGVGGGILLFPFLIYYNFSVPEAVAISLFLNAVPNTFPGLYLYYKEGHLHFYIALIIAIGTLIGSFYGSFLGANEYFDKKTIFRLYTLILVSISVYMYYYFC